MCALVYTYICIYIPIHSHDAPPAQMIIWLFPRDTSFHIRTARAKPTAAHRRRHNHPPPPQTREHSPTARQSHM